MQISLVKFFLLGTIFLFFVLPSTVLACTCYTEESELVIIDDYCPTVCGEDEATSSAFENNSSEGICTCTDGTEETAGCEYACDLNKYYSEDTKTIVDDGSTSSTSSRELIKPRLSIDIPTVTFSDGLIATEEGRRYLSVNYLGDYISGVYTYILGFATTIAIVMIMVSGLQWALGGTSAEAIGKAKTRIKNAVTGLVLLLSTYVILFTVNPNLINLQFPELQIIESDGIHENENDVVNGSVATSFGTPSSSNVYGKAKNLVPTELVPDIEAVAKKLEEQGYGMTITSGYRSLKEQKRQISLKCKNPPGSATCDPIDGKTVACILKDNNPANCPHTTGRALDIWGTEFGSSSQCITQSRCSPSAGASDPCRLNECQAALITAMKEQGFCNLSSEAWHFEKPKMSTKCN